MPTFLARIAVANAPGAGLRPRYSPGTILSLYPDKPTPRNWGDERYMFKRVSITKEQEALVQSKKLKLSDLKVVAGVNEITDNVRYEGFVAQHHEDIWKGVVDLSLHMNEEQKQILAIAQYVRPNAMGEHGPREIKRAFTQSAVILYKQALVKTKIGVEPTLCESVVYQAVRDRKRVNPPKELVQEITRQYSNFRGLIGACELNAKAEISRNCTITYDDKIHDLTSTGLVNAPEWEHIADINPLEDIEPEPEPRINTGDNQLDSLNPLDPTYTVGDGKTYSTIQAAVNAIPGSLSGQGVQTVEVYAKAPNNIYVEAPNVFAGFSGPNENVDYVHVKSMVSHAGLATGGITINVGTTRPGINLYYWFRLSGFVITGDDSTVGVNANLVQTYYGHIYNNIIHGVKNTGSVSWAGVYSLFVNKTYIYNNIIYGLGIDVGAAYAVCGIRVGSSGATLDGYFVNNTVCGLYGLNSGCVQAIRFNQNDSNITNKNNYSGGHTVESGTIWDFYLPGTNIVSDYNISSDDTADNAGGANNLINKAAANQFVNLTGGSEDFHLKSGADCLGAGADLSGTFTDDIDGDVRSAWDVGADEFTAAGGSNPALHTTMVMGAF